MSTCSGSVPSALTRVTLEYAIYSLISLCRSQNTAKKFTQNVLKQLRFKPRTLPDTAASQTPLPTKTLAKILAVLPYGVNTCIFENLPYPHLQSLCKSQNSNIRSAALTCLTKKLKQQLHVSHANRENVLYIFDLLSQSFNILFEYSHQIPIAIRALFEGQKLDSFLKHLETIPCDQLLLLNSYLLKIKESLNHKALELFLKMFTTKIYRNQAQLALLDENSLQNYVRMLLTVAFETQNLKILKLSLLFYPKIIKLNPGHIKYILYKSALINFKEYSEIIIDHLFKTYASDPDRSLAASICVYSIYYYVLFNRIHLLSNLLNKMPFRQEEVIQAIQKLQPSSNETEHYRYKFNTFIIILKHHYNI